MFHYTFTRGGGLFPKYLQSGLKVFWQQVVLVFNFIKALNFVQHTQNTLMFRCFCLFLCTVSFRNIDALNL